MHGPCGLPCALGGPESAILRAAHCRRSFHQGQGDGAGPLVYEISGGLFVPGSSCRWQPFFLAKQMWLSSTEDELDGPPSTDTGS